MNEARVVCWTAVVDEVVRQVRCTAEQRLAGQRETVKIELVGVAFAFQGEISSTHRYRREVNE